MKIGTLANYDLICIMITYISASVIYPVSKPPIKNGVIGIDEKGKIHAVLNENEAKTLENVLHYDGALVPGFINTHCHLELSHMRNKIKEGTGLTNFIKAILKNRQQPDEEVFAAMKVADQEMCNNGIVAVGDISNVLLSRDIKLESSIYYHTFIEVFGFNRPSAPIITEGMKLKTDFSPLKSSIVPHAPYSVSSELFKQVKAVLTEDDIQSIHNQETIGENELFEKGTGSFADFFAELGIAQSDAHQSGENALKYHLPQLAKNINTLLVHNTFSNKNDIAFAEAEHQKLYWCLCPNANLYIENTLPDVKLLNDEAVKITLGTDSLASNHQLSILAEMLTLQNHKDISFEDSLKWATLNGAEFLGIETEYGSLSVGKKPGVLLINLNEGDRITTDTMIKRLF